MSDSVGTIAQLLLIEPTDQNPSMPLSFSKREYSQTRFFSNLLSDYSAQSPSLKAFIRDFPTQNSFADQIRLKEDNFPIERRKLLADKLTEQYKGLTMKPKQSTNIDLLRKANTFTISSGHQLNIGGGPGYVLYKLLTVIKLAQDLQEKYPDYNFVPLHWLASEDHDLAEVSEITFFGNKLLLEVEGSGPVGKLKPGTVASQFKTLRDFPEWMIEIYEKSENLTAATRSLIQYVFGETGLLCLDADDKDFKSLFSELSLKELAENWVEPEVKKQSAKLEEHGYKAQIHARPINLFYMDEGIRTRLEEVDGQVKTTENDFSWTKAEAVGMFKERPELLSPNVAFRPLYSQYILPDIAFVGGPAEIAYWMQLKPVFEKAGTVFPLLIPRFTTLFISSSQKKKMEKLGLDEDDLFLEMHQVKKSLLLEEWIKPDLQLVYAPLIEMARKIDQTLVPGILAELVKIEKIMEGQERKIQKAAEQKNEQQINQISNLMAKLFPNGGLQERTESWASLLVTNPDIVAELLNGIEPLDFRFSIVTES